MIKDLITKFVKDILTTKDNQSYDNGRVAFAVSLATYIGLAVASIYHGNPWTATQFAGGVSAMAVGFGINLRLKSPTEPDKKND